MQQPIFEKKKYIVIMLQILVFRVTEHGKEEVFQHGVFTAISIDSGKVLDVEPMSRLCKSCFLKTDPTSYAEWRNSHCRWHVV